MSRWTAHSKRTPHHRITVHNQKYNTNHGPWRKLKRVQLSNIRFKWRRQTEDANVHVYASIITELFSLFFVKKIGLIYSFADSRRRNLFMRKVLPKSICKELKGPQKWKYGLPLGLLMFSAYSYTLSFRLPFWSEFGKVRIIFIGSLVILLSAARNAAGH